MLSTICFIWATSEHYNTPSRVIVILREFCNQIIEMVTTFPSLVFPHPLFFFGLGILRLQAEAMPGVALKRFSQGALLASRQHQLKGWNPGHQSILKSHL